MSSDILDVTPPNQHQQQLLLLQQEHQHSTKLNRLHKFINTTFHNFQLNQPKSTSCSPESSLIFERSILSGIISPETPQHYNLENYSSPILDTTTELIADPTVNYDHIKLNCYDDDQDQDIVEDFSPRSRSRSIISNSLMNCLNCKDRKISRTNSQKDLKEEAKKVDENNHQDCQTKVNFDFQQLDNTSSNNNQLDNTLTESPKLVTNQGINQVANQMANNQVVSQVNSQVDDGVRLKQKQHLKEQGKQENSIVDKDAKKQRHLQEINDYNDKKFQVKEKVKIIDNDDDEIESDDDEVVIDFYSFADIVYCETNGRERKGSCYTISATDYIGLP
jgi:hypothetical protein